MHFKHDTTTVEIGLVTSSCWQTKTRGGTRPTSQGNSLCKEARYCSGVMEHPPSLISARAAKNSGFCCPDRSVSPCLLFMKRKPGFKKIA